MASKTTAQSSAERQSGPTVSWVQASVMPPYRLTRPNVGRKPATPFRSAGPVIDPPVSVPMEKPTSPAAVAAPGPADEPAASSLVFHGLRVKPPNHCAPTARAPVDNFATMIAPAVLSFV